MWVIKLRNNTNKMEVLLVGPHSALGSRYTLTLDRVVLPLKDHVFSLALAHLDPALLLDKQVAAVARSTFHQLQLAHQLRP